MTLAIGKENAQRKNLCSLISFISHSEAFPKLAQPNRAKQTDESTLLTQTASSTEIEVYKKRLNQLTLSPSFNHQLSCTFLPFSNFASRLLRLLFSHHTPPPPPISLFLSLFSCRPLLSPGGMRQFWRLAVCVMAWAPEMGILWWCGDYSSRSLGCTTLTHSSSTYILYVHIRRHWFPTEQIVKFSHHHHHHHHTFMSETWLCWSRMNHVNVCWCVWCGVWLMATKTLFSPKFLHANVVGVFFKLFFGFSNPFSQGLQRNLGASP